MSTYKGNVGHLMQHWTLCELLTIAGKHTSGLSFIDAHAMAPHAHTRTVGNRRFDRVRDGLPGTSACERGWQYQAPQAGYPNGAAFVEQLWTRDFSMLLCEIDPSTIAQLNPWLRLVGKSDRCRNTQLFPDDWRYRFDMGLPSPVEVSLLEGSLTLVSFDPYMYDSSRRFDDQGDRNKGNLYPDDIERALPTLRGLQGGIIIQLSTYSRGHNNAAPQEDVIASVNKILTPVGFAQLAVVRVNLDMMSLVYAHDVTPEVEVELVRLPDRFTRWLPRR